MENKIASHVPDIFFILHIEEVFFELLHKFEKFSILLLKNGHH